MLIDVLRTGAAAAGAGRAVEREAELLEREVQRGQRAHAAVGAHAELLELTGAAHADKYALCLCGRGGGGVGVGVGSWYRGGGGRQREHLEAHEVAFGHLRQALELVAPARVRRRPEPLARRVPQRLHEPVALRQQKRTELR